MTKSHANILSYAFIAITIAVAAYLYPSLPDPMPTHWNEAGEVNGYMPKPWGVAILPLIPIFILVVMRLIPVISPKGYRTDEFSNVLNLFQVVLVGFASFVALLVLLEAKGIDVRINQMVFAALGLLFIILGNYFGKIRKNFFLGIRTPWTLASDEVWARTHRLGGRLFVLMGLIMLVAVAFPMHVGWIVLVVLGVAFVPIVYSYFIYRRVEGFAEDVESEL